MKMFLLSKGTKKRKLFEVQNLKNVRVKTLIL